MLHSTLGGIGGVQSLVHYAPAVHASAFVHVPVRNVEETLALLTHVWPRVRLLGLHEEMLTSFKSIIDSNVDVCLRMYC